MIPIHFFGLALAVAFLCVVFLVWKQARKLGLSEEKVLDTLFLTVIFSLIIGRLAYVYLNPAIFSLDISRAFLFTKYPGISFIPSLLTGIAVSGVLARNSGIATLLIWDVFALPMVFAEVFGLFGCFLDSCVQNISTATFTVLIIGSILWGILLVFISKFIENRAELSEISKKHGLLFLLYLLFQSISLLMLTAQSWLWVIMIASLGVFVVRYSKLLRHVYDSISKKRSGTDRDLS